MFADILENGVIDLLRVCHHYRNTYDRLGDDADEKIGYDTNGGMFYAQRDENKPQSVEAALLLHQDKRIIHLIA